jgi:hypothetical protein
VVQSNGGEECDNKALNGWPDGNRNGRICRSDCSKDTIGNSPGIISASACGDWYNTSIPMSCRPDGSLRRVGYNSDGTLKYYEICSNPNDSSTCTQTTYYTCGLDANHLISQVLCQGLSCPCWNGSSCIACPSTSPSCTQ